MRKFVLSASYRTPPLFLYEELPIGEYNLLNSLGVSTKPYNGPVDIDKLEWPTDLINAIKVWDTKYQLTFCMTNPKASGFKTADLARQHQKEGERLKYLIQEQLGNAAVADYHT